MSFSGRVEHLIQELNEAKASTKEDVERFRIKFLGSKGVFKDLFSEFKQVSSDEKRQFGKQLNELKARAEGQFSSWSKEFSEGLVANEAHDLTRPGMTVAPGAHHPISIIKDEIIDIFHAIGFSVAEGPEIEDDWHNFSALNFPPEHPARDMQDTFFIKDPNGGQDYVLRTHTSSVQVRTMENEKPPIRIIAPGRVFRNEAVSARSHCIFHQIEGLYIDKGVTFADMKQTLEYFAKAFFGKSKIRLRPSYFPFTEPSAEMDVYWGLENELDHRITKGTGWLEVMGCGMVDPAVLASCGIDPEVYSGFAFGMGLERSAMQRFQIPDIRMIFENDVRFLSQFQSAI
ncbi:phenylalanine--tRNA ligase subunit alpha [Salibacteraceae bacterium]|jgi:phenylalanyl-tRNA synthetase alpha chain|nr:phenylalanine--tRNA ligase subunit alpha [Flavobacteriales bacterium]MDC1202606.1 phenylalanine--tRNA ligase subunit alpha [Salibacteraceae bacterium]HAW21369.1 phenylalanine--tRNA ligase subunit alpha [Flavobacteriales bacterium]